jgi:hypothetical protein
LTVFIHHFQVLHGTLVHITFIFPDGSSRLPVFSNFMTGYKGNTFRTLHLSESFLRGLSWWRTKLSDPTAFRQLHPIACLQDLDLFVDASTSWGIGIIIGEFWHAFQLVDNWKQPGHDICWLESLAIEFLTYFLRQLGHSNSHLLIHSDSDGAMGAHNKHRSPNIPINLAVRRTYAVLAECIIVPSFKYIESALNPADPISRGESGSPVRTWLPRRFDIPSELQVFFHVDD